MYHHVALDTSEGLTVSVENLERHFQFLNQNGYQTHHLSELQSMREFQHKKNTVITFDDAYVSQLQFAYPLLQKYNLKATFFVPLKYVGKEDEWNQKRSPIMSATQLKSLDPAVVELAYHSYAHGKYHELSEEGVKVDTEKAIKAASESDLPIAPFLAYPYGKFPRKNPRKASFFKQLKGFEFQLGLRIGNRLNRFPFKKPFEVQRIDVKGEWNLTKFSRMLRFGKRF